MDVFKKSILIVKRRFDCTWNIWSSSFFRSYEKEFQMPPGVQADQLTSSYSSSGILAIEAPRCVSAPEGVDLQESMAAKSKAYTTDDGKTSVSEKSQASSQVRVAIFLFKKKKKEPKYTIGTRYNGKVCQDSVRVTQLKTTGFANKCTHYNGILTT